MQMKLRNPSLTSVYGLPDRDCEYSEAVKVYTDRGWTKDAARVHVNAAISAGAYEPIQPVIPKKIKVESKEH